MKKLALFFFFLGATWSPFVGAIDVPSDPNQPNNPCASWNVVQEPEFYTDRTPLNIHTSGTVSQIDSFLRLRSGDNKFSSHMKGCAGEKRVWLSPSNDYNYYSKSETGSAIALRFSPTMPQPGVNTDKMMWNIRDKRAGGSVRMGDTVYTAFAFKVPENFSAPLHGQNFMIFQVWQGSPFHPPVSMHVNGTGEGDPKTQPLSLELRLITMNLNKYARQILTSTPIVRGQWIELIVGVRFDQTNGSFSLRKREGDQFKLVAQQGGLQTAFDPLENFVVRDDVTYQPNEAAAVLLGLYRVRQPTRHSVLFDEIRVGTTLSSVLLPEPVDSSRDR